MNAYALIYPMAAMVLLTFIVLCRMFLSRVDAVKRGEVDARYYKTYQGDNTEPRAVAQNSRHFKNLLEAPVLFYAACLAAIMTGQGVGPILWLAWIYVAVRVVHTVIHLGSNRIPPRVAAYATSWIVLVAMWGVLVAGVATG